MSISLPDVEQQWTADVAPYVAGMAEAIAVAEEFSKANIDAAKSVGVLQAAIDGLHGKDINIDVNTSGLGGAGLDTAGLAAIESAVGEVKDSLNSMAAERRSTVRSRSRR